jgi:hypothetical protein
MQQEESRYDRGLGTMKTIFGPGIESAVKGLAAHFGQRLSALARGVDFRCGWPSTSPLRHQQW